MGQAKNVTDDGINIDSQDELIRLQCEFYRKLNALLCNSAAENLGRRIEYIARGSYMPAAGTADIATIAGLLNLDERTIYDQLKKSQHEQLGFGRTVFYALADWFLAKRTPEAKPRAKK